MQVRKRDTSRIYALKTIRKQYIVQRGEITHTQAERLVLARVNNPFIVPLKFSFQSEQKLYLVLAYVVCHRGCGMSLTSHDAASSMEESSSTISNANKDSTRCGRASTARNCCSRWSICTSLTSSTGQSVSLARANRR